MATTKLWHIKGRLRDLIEYVENPVTAVRGTFVVVVTEGSYTRYAVHLTCRNMSRMSETECTVRMYQHKRTKTASDNEHCFLLCY